MIDDLFLFLLTVAPTVIIKQKCDHILYSRYNYQLKLKEV